MRKLIVGNWKMNGLAASLAEASAIAAGAAETCRRSCHLPAGDTDRADALGDQGFARSGSAGRIATPRPRAPIPATSRPKCSPMPAPRSSSSAIPSGGPTMARPTPMCAPRPKPAGAPGSPPSSASARPRRSGTPARRRERRRRPARRLGAGLAAGRRGRRLVVAYEPVWAIGTGRMPSEADIAAMHAHIRSDSRPGSAPRRQACAFSTEGR